MKDFINLLKESEEFNYKLDWIKSLRIFSEERLKEQGFPSIKNDEWIYTKTFPIEQSHFKFNYSKINVKEKNTFVFNNSTLNYGVLEEGIEIIEVKDNIEFLNKIIENEKDLPFINLNYAFFNQSLIINISKNLSSNINIIYKIEQNYCSFPFVLINISENLNISIVERTFSSENSFRNSVSKIYIGKNSFLNYYKFQREKGLVVDNSNLFLSRESNLKIFTTSQGSKILRNNLNISLCDENSNISAYSLYNCRGDEHIDNNTLIEHLVPNCSSIQLYKGIVDDKSKASFTGRIFVAKNAQKTNASQLNKNLLIGDKAEINTRPQLQIEANDVKCSHGATIGQLSKEQLFYLETRYLNKIEAVKILKGAFIEDIINRSSEKFHDEIRELILYN